MALRQARITVQVPARAEPVRAQDDERDPLEGIGKLLDALRHVPDGAVMRHHAARPLVGDQHARDVADPGEHDAPPFHVDIGHRDGGAAGRPQGGVHAVEELARGQQGTGREDPDGCMGRIRGRRPVPEPVRDHQLEPAPVRLDAPGVAACLFTALRQVDRPGEGLRPRLHCRRTPRLQAHQDRRAETRPGINVRDMRTASDRPEAGARAAGRRMAVSHRCRHVRHAGSLVEGEALEAAARAVGVGADEELAPGAVLDQVRGELRRHDGDPT